MQTGCLSSGVKDLQQQHPRLEAALLQWNAHHHQHCPHHLKCSSHHHDHDASGWFVTWAAARESFRWKTCSGLIGHQCIKPQLLRCYIWTVLSILQHYAIKLGSQWMLLRWAASAVESIEVQWMAATRTRRALHLLSKAKDPKSPHNWWAAKNIAALSLDIQLAIHYLYGLISVIWIVHTKTSQDLRMLFSVTIHCQVTKIVINPGSQFSVL